MDRRHAPSPPEGSADLLHRRMADAVLRRGQSQHYDHAVRELAAAERLVPNVEDWLGHELETGHIFCLRARARGKSQQIRQFCAGGDFVNYTNPLILLDT